MMSESTSTSSTSRETKIPEEEHAPLNAARPAEEEEEEEYENENENENAPSSSMLWSSRNVIAMKCLMAGMLLYAALVAYTTTNNIVTTTVEAETSSSSSSSYYHYPRRRLTAVMGDIIPSYMDALTKDLKERKKLFDDTPPEEVKYWFEYSGPLQKYFYRFSKSRSKADYFEGRDDSGVTSFRFTEEFLGGPEHNRMFHGGGRAASGDANNANNNNNKSSSSKSKPGSNQHTMQFRLLENCLAMGSPARPDTNTPLWKEWYGGGGGSTAKQQQQQQHVTHGTDRCRVLFTLNTVGAGRGTTMLWETAPPSLPHSQGPEQWTSEQETAAIHLQRQLEEIDAMCDTNQIAARVQILVCEPISGRWTEWMDSLLPHCGGTVSDLYNKMDVKSSKVEERASPVQVVVVATMESADTCHDLKSGFMERRTQDLILAPPFLGDGDGNDGSGKKDIIIENPAIKRTHPDLISSDDHDLYVGLKWTSMVTLRAVHSFLQASADMAAGATSPINNKKEGTTATAEDESVDVAVSNAPSSPFLIPSFLRVSYVSEENAKVAKWRMHGDFFHPAAWEICKDSFELTWIDHSLSGPGGVNGLCYEPSTKSAMKRRLNGNNGNDNGNGNDGSSSSSSSTTTTTDCGQWWVYMTELQMPTSPDIYANEITPPVVQGGSNFVWMVTERQRREIVKRQICMHSAENKIKAGKEKAGKDDSATEKKRALLIKECPAPPQAVIPLGDMESFLINYSPNTALGKKHVKGRRPGYSREHERELERELVRERKQLKGQEDIEKALFDYTIYPAALFRKDATLKAARARDAVLVAEAEAKAAASAKSKSNAHNDNDKEGGGEKEKEEEVDIIGPKWIKSEYYDVTVTKPRAPVLGWCQAIARKGLCTLYSDYFRTSSDVRCLEACGMKKNFSPI